MPVTTPTEPCLRSHRVFAFRRPSCRAEIGALKTESQDFVGYADRHSEHSWICLLISTYMCDRILKSPSFLTWWLSYSDRVGQLSPIITFSVYPHLPGRNLRNVRNKIGLCQFTMNPVRDPLLENSSNFSVAMRRKQNRPQLCKHRRLFWWQNSTMIKRAMHSECSVSLTLPLPRDHGHVISLLVLW